MKEHWIDHPNILEGDTVEIVPLEKEHLEALYLAASDKKLWELTPVFLPLITGIKKLISPFFRIRIG